MTRPRYFNNKRLNQAFIRATRVDAAAKQGNKCHYCRSSFAYTKPTADHKHAKFHGGADAKENIVAACEACNTAKGHMSVKLFTRMIESPRAGEPIKYRIIGATLRINRRIELMQKRVGRFIGMEIQT